MSAASSVPSMGANDREAIGWIVASLSQLPGYVPAIRFEGGYLTSMFLALCVPPCDEVSVRSSSAGHRRTRAGIRDRS